MFAEALAYCTISTRETTMELLLIILFAAILGIGAQTWGVDETDASADPRRQVRPVGLS